MMRTVVVRDIRGFSGYMMAVYLWSVPDVIMKAHVKLIGMEQR